MKASLPILMTLIFTGVWHGIYTPYCVEGIGPISGWMVPIGYAAALMLLYNSYNALKVGLVRISEMVYSQIMAHLIVDAVSYCMMSLYAHFFVPILPMLCLIAGQCLVGVVWSVSANKIYFANYRPPISAMIYRNHDDLEKIRDIRYFMEHFNIQKMIENPRDDIREIMKQLDGIQVVFIAGIPATLRNGIIKHCVANNMEAYVVPHLGDIIMSGAVHMSMFSVPLMKVRRSRIWSVQLLIKRLMDIVISAVGIVLTAPIMLVTACAIKLQDGGPVLYRQIRLTLNGREFSILKFRSMRTDAEKDGVARLASENDDRITPIGHLIRATRIDELPQLFNIFMGDMSVVGPRPERPEIAAQYEKEMPEFALRLQMKAGLTGMAQVYGQYNTPPYSKLQMDLMYINKASLMLDFKLLLATIKILFMKESTEGVQAGQATAMKHCEASEQKKSA